MAMSNSETETLFGAVFCKEFGHQFARTFLRKNINIDQFWQEVLNYVASKDDLDAQLANPFFWIQMIDSLNSKYLLEHCSIKSSVDWLTAAREFFSNIYAQEPSYQLDKTQTKKLKDAMKSIFSEKQLNSCEELLAHIEQIYQINCQNLTESNTPANNQIHSPLLLSTQTTTSTELNSSNNNITHSNDENLLDSPHSNESIQQTSEVLNEPTITEKEASEHGLNQLDHNIVVLETQLCEEVESPKKNINENLNKSISSDTTIIDNNVYDSDKNIEEEVVEKATIDSIESLGIAEVLDTNEDISEPSRANGSPKKKLSLDNVTDSLEIGKSRYIKKRRQFALGSNRDSREQALRELRSILIENSSPEKNSKYNGSPKKIQLRPTHTEKLSEIPSLSDLENSDNFSDDDDDSTAAASASLASRLKQNQLLNNKAKHAYTMEEDYKILKFIIDSNRYNEIRGNQLWKDMQERHIIRSRTWQSMKERFKKNILGNIWIYVEMYKLEKKVVPLLQENFAVSNPTSSKALPKREGNSGAISSNYTHEEDDAIIMFISHQLDSNDSPMGTIIWKKAEKYFHRQLNRQRTWQSLKERFIKRIIPRMDKYDKIEKFLSYQKAMIIIEKSYLSSSDKNAMKKKLKMRYNKS